MCELKKKKKNKLIDRIMLQFSAPKYAKFCDLDNIQDDTFNFKNMIDETNHT